MRYLVMPAGYEELVVRGRYELAGSEADSRGHESWELYRNLGSPLVTVRSELCFESSGWTGRVLAHALVSEEGPDRVKLLTTAGNAPGRRTTLTFEADGVLINEDQGVVEVALPAGYGIVIPQASLARWALPFDLASEARHVALTLLVRIVPGSGTLTWRATKFAFDPLGFREQEVKGLRLKVRGWRMTVPGLPSRDAWFDRNGVCVAMAGSLGQPLTTAELVEWTSFG